MRSTMAPMATKGRTAASGNLPGILNTIEPKMQPKISGVSNISWFRARAAANESLPTQWPKLAPRRLADAFPVAEQSALGTFAGEAAAGAAAGFRIVCCP